MAEDEGDAGDGAHLVGFELGVATDDNDRGAGVLTDELMDSLATFVVGHLRDAACVDDADVRHLAFLHLANTHLLQLTGDGGSLGKVQLAT